MRRGSKARDLLHPEIAGSIPLIWEPNVLSGSLFNYNPASGDPFDDLYSVHCRLPEEDPPSELRLTDLWNVFRPGASLDKLEFEPVRRWTLGPNKARHTRVHAPRDKWSEIKSGKINREGGIVD